MDKKQRLKMLICELLMDGTEMTGREIAQDLYAKGYVYSPYREAVAPRLTELARGGLIKETGKKFDSFTKKEVKVYGIK